MLGLLGLWGGTLLTVRGAVELSERHGLSQGFVGLTVLAIGTDLPELLVSISGSVQQLQGIEASGVIVGNATGSAMAQGTLALGVAGLVGYLGVAPRMVAEMDSPSYSRSGSPRRSPSTGTWATSRARHCC